MDNDQNSSIVPGSGQESLSAQISVIQNTPAQPYLSSQPSPGQVTQSGQPSPADEDVEQIPNNPGTYDDWRTPNGDRYEQFLRSHHAFSDLSSIYSSIALEESDTLRSNFAFIAYYQDIEDGTAQHRALLPRAYKRENISKPRLNLWRRMLRNVTNDQHALNQHEANSSLFYELASALRETSTTTIQTLCLVRSASYTERLFSYWRMLRMTGKQTGLSQKKRSQVPFRLFVPLLEYTNFLSAESRQQVTHLISPHPITLKRLLVEPPSRATSTRLYYSLSWPHSAPSYSWVNSYIWQKHLKEPLFEKIDIVFDTRLSAPSRTVVILPNESALLHHLYWLECHIDKGKTNTFELPTESAPLFEIVLLLRQMIDRYIRFLRDSFQRMESIRRSARSSPGRSKHFGLLLLTDYVERSHQELENAIEISDTILSKPIPEQMLPMVNRTRKDIEYLLCRIEDMSKDIVVATSELETLNNFKQAQRGATIGFLVGLYVPMAFVSSYFGMNTIEINGSNWSLWTFWASAIPITALTIGLPVTLGRIIRTMFKSAYLLFDTIRAAWISIVDWTLTLAIFAMVVRCIVLTLDRFSDYFDGPLQGFQDYLVMICNLFWFAITNIGRRYWQFEPLLTHTAFAILFLFKWAGMHSMELSWKNRGAWYFAFISIICLVCAFASVGDRSSATYAVPFCCGISFVSLEFYLKSKLKVRISRLLNRMRVKIKHI